MSAQRLALACSFLLAACGPDHEAGHAGTSAPGSPPTAMPAAPAPAEPSPFEPAPFDPAPPPTVPREVPPAPPATDTAPGIVHVPAGEAPAWPGETGLADAADPAAQPPPAADEEPTRAVAFLSPASGSSVIGSVSFERSPDGVGILVHVTLDNLTPGEHGLHVHQHGDCTAFDAASAGEHFDTANAPHAGRDMNPRHVGDLGNVLADERGHVDVTFTDAMIALSGADSIIGRSVVVHADPDDLVSQPSGNSGARVACGVIVKSPSSAGS